MNHPQGPPTFPPTSKWGGSTHIRSYLFGGVWQLRSSYATNMLRQGEEWYESPTKSIPLPGRGTLLVPTSTQLPFSYLVARAFKQYVCSDTPATCNIIFQSSLHNAMLNAVILGIFGTICWQHNMLVSLQHHPHGSSCMIEIILIHLHACGNNT